MAKGKEMDFDGVGRLWVEDGRVRFEGNASKAAKILFDDHLKPLCDGYIATRVGGAPAFVAGGTERAVSGPSEKRSAKNKGANDGND